MLQYSRNFTPVMGCTSSAVEDVSHAKARGSQVTPVGCCCATTSAAAAAASVNSSSETEPANIVDEAVTAKGHGARLAQGAEKIKTGGALVVAPISWQRGEVIGQGAFGERFNILCNGRFQRRCHVSSIWVEGYY